MPEKTETAADTGRTPHRLRGQLENLPRFTHLALGLVEQRERSTFHSLAQEIDTLDSWARGLRSEG